MKQSSLNHLIDCYEQLRDEGRAEEMSDARLLQRYVELGDDLAFTRLVRRYGPMVLGICRRILRNPHAAEDAFQATFLVLARKAGAVRHRERLAGWLHGVATRTALHARSELHRWPTEGLPAEPLSEEQDPSQSASDHETWALLDEIVHQLPGSYREPVVLCYFQGLTYNEAARELGWPPGTVSGRLARARQLLRGLLAERGVILSLPVLATLLGEAALRAEVPSALVAPILAREPLTSGARFLTQWMMRSMMMTKMKAVLVALVLICTLGMGGSGEGGAQPAPGSPPEKEAKKPEIREEQAKIENLELQIQQLRQEQAKAQASLRKMLDERGEKVREEVFGTLDRELAKLRSAVKHDQDKRIAVEKFLIDFIRLRHALSEEDQKERFPTVGHVFEVRTVSYSSGKEVLISLGYEDNVQERTELRVLRLLPEVESVGTVSVQQVGRKTARGIYRTLDSSKEVRVGDIVIPEQNSFRRGTPPVRTLPKVLVEQLKKLDLGK